MRHRLFALVSAAICAACAFGQTSASFTSGSNSFSGSASFGAPPPFMAREFTGAPYSAERASERVQTLADGTHITQRSATTKVYRDSAGRTREERPPAVGIRPAGRVQESPTVVEITDPVAQVKYTLDPINKVAHRQQLQAAPERLVVSNGAVQKGFIGGTDGAAVVGPAGVGAAGAVLRPAVAPSERIRPEMSAEKLPQQTIEGVMVQGTRNTTTWPVDSQGNDRPFSVVSETWTSVELKVMVLNRQNDPRSGEYIQKLINISQAEPDASLFQPPADYTVVDESGAFTIEWGSRR